MTGTGVSDRLLDRVLCGTCVHVTLGHQGLRCALFGDPIWDEREAQTCLAFDPAAMIT